jgi:hypothetical protein
MTPSEARAHRAELEAALANAERSYTDNTIRRQEAETERAQATRALAALRTAHATGGATDKQVEAATKRVMRADQDHARQHEAVNYAYDAARALERRLDELFGEHLEAFAMDAQESTRQAAAALLALEEPYEAARSAWDAAARAWAPLARAAAVQGVEPFPVPSVFRDVRAGALVPRPASVVVTTAADEAAALD